MSHSIDWSDEALFALAEITEYIAQDKPGAARRWNEGIVAAVELLHVTPYMGRRYAAGRGPEDRELVRGNYNIVYRVTDDAIHVLTIFEGHRLPPTPSEP